MRDLNNERDYSTDSEQVRKDQRELIKELVLSV
jgi:hypothetical protein